MISPHEQLQPSSPDAPAAALHHSGSMRLAHGHCLAKGTQTRAQHVCSRCQGWSNVPAAAPACLWRFMAPCRCRQPAQTLPPAPARLRVVKELCVAVLVGGLAAGGAVHALPHLLVGAQAQSMGEFMGSLSCGQLGRQLSRLRPLPSGCQKMNLMKTAKHRRQRPGQ